MIINYKQTTNDNILQTTNQRTNQINYKQPMIINYKQTTNDNKLYKQITNDNKLQTNNQ